MFGYRVPAPNEALLISGGNRGGDGAPFRVVTGQGAFVIPVLRKADILSLDLHEALIKETCVTTQGVELSVSAVVAFKVGNDNESIVNAAQRFLSSQKGAMAGTVGEIFAGHLRSIIGSMTVEQIIRQREVLASQVLDSSNVEMGRMGLIVDSMQIRSIDDCGSGYIDSLRAPHLAQVEREAKIAQAEADRAAAEAQQESRRRQAEYTRETAIKESEIQAETDRAKAEAAQAGPLAQATAQREVLEAQSELAVKQAALREKQLQSEVIKPAEAKARETEILAKAKAEEIRILAEAAASNGRVALDQTLIEQLPLIVEAAAKGLANSNLTILNGQEGVNDTISGMVGQGLAVFGALQKGILNGDNDDEQSGLHEIAG
ncbi:flotillin [Rhodococcus sp. HNM0563]|uniref:flotillin family protein n=1 Tax=unclassified Rhodococcus (in: high G+C Gram-positive bacteria) TaxID=192944 RepID=UPI00146BF4D4|nr:MULTISPECIES: flotillin family protein [unclassified Rhodococcus (in: high G+C Gram-positive bacteria)]MCK0093476.1 SPFH domain-containing protein [Rhodococcus sp. F64268]NLU64810.1 flotillin [Rhodococcus sp. HNM0563]